MKIVLAVMLLVVSFWSSAESVKVTLYADGQYPPFTFSEQGKVRGIYAEVLALVSAKMPDYDIELVLDDWKKARAKAEQGEILGLVGTYNNADIWPNIYPYSYPLNQETVVTVCNTKVATEKKRQWPSGYTGMLVGNIAGYDGWMRGGVRTKENTAHANFLEVPSVELALDMVINDRLDCTLFEESVFYWASSHHPAYIRPSVKKGTPAYIDSIISGETVHIGYSTKAMTNGKFPYARDFIEKLDIVLHDMSRSGELAVVKKRYGIKQ